MKPNQLRITVTDRQGKEISVITELTSIQQLGDTQGDKAVDAAVLKMFKDIIERMKNPPRQ